jgi:hypothetical protein
MGMSVCQGGASETLAISAQICSVLGLLCFEIEQYQTLEAIKTGVPAHENKFRGAFSGMAGIGQRSQGKDLGKTKAGSPRPCSDAPEPD